MAEADLPAPPLTWGHLVILIQNLETDGQTNSCGQTSTCFFSTNRFFFSFVD